MHKIIVASAIIDQFHTFCKQIPETGIAPRQLVKVKVVPDASIVRQHSSLATRPEHMAERKVLDLKRWYVPLSLTHIRTLVPPFYIMFHVWMCTHVCSVVEHCSCIMIYTCNNVTLDIAQLLTCYGTDSREPMFWLFAQNSSRPYLACPTKLIIVMCCYCSVFWPSHISPRECKIDPL